MWRTEVGCEETITKAWVPKVRGSPMVQVEDMIHRCGKDLTVWSRANFGSVTRKIREKKEELKKAEEQSTLGRGHDRVLSIR